ncbi:MAG: hypothetical protein AAGA01_10675, partial [Cyanobacteria bacterium P01_E01_bin.43]
MNQSTFLRIFLVSAVFSGYASWELARFAQAEIWSDGVASNPTKSIEENNSEESGKRDRPKSRAISSQRSPLFSALENGNQSQINSVVTEPVILVGEQSAITGVAVASTAIALTATPAAPPAASTDAPALAQANDNEEDEDDEADFSAPPANLEFTGEDTIRLTVTGTRTPIRINDLPATVTVFELEDFEFYQFQNLRDLL